MEFNFDIQTLIALYMLAFVVWEFSGRVAKKLPELWSVLKNRKKLKTKIASFAFGVLITVLMFAPVVYYGNNSLKIHHTFLHLNIHYA